MATFSSHARSFEVSETDFKSAAETSAVPAVSMSSFSGFDRGTRGAGTRNYVLLLGVSSRAAAYVLDTSLCPCFFPFYHTHDVICTLK